MKKKTFHTHAEPSQLRERKKRENNSISSKRTLDVSHKLEYFTFAYAYGELWSYCYPFILLFPTINEATHTKKKQLNKIHSCIVCRFDKIIIWKIKVIGAISYWLRAKKRIGRTFELADIRTFLRFFLSISHIKNRIFVRS